MNVKTRHESIDRSVNEIWPNEHILTAGNLIRVTLRYGPQLAEDR